MANSDETQMPLNEDLHEQFYSNSKRKLILFLLLLLLLFTLIICYNIYTIKKKNFSNIKYVTSNKNEEKYYSKKSHKKICSSFDC